MLVTKTYLIRLAKERKKADKVVLDSQERVSMVCSELREQSIEARPFWMPVHQQAPYRRALSEAMPTTEELWSRIVTLPCSTSLDAADQQRPDSGG